jgi:hypothetical protein
MGTNCAPHLADLFLSPKMKRTKRYLWSL